MPSSIFYKDLIQSWQLLSTTGRSAQVGGALANRQSLVVFGSLGEAAFVLWLTNDLFYDSWSYPFVLTAVGLLIIFIGIQVQKYISNRT